MLFQPKNLYAEAAESELPDQPPDNSALVITNVHIQSTEGVVTETRRLKFLESTGDQTPFLYMNFTGDLDVEGSLRMPLFHPVSKDIISSSEWWPS